MQHVRQLQRTYGSVCVCVCVCVLVPVCAPVPVCASASDSGNITSGLTPRHASVCVARLRKNTSLATHSSSARVNRRPVCGASVVTVLVVVGLVVGVVTLLALSGAPTGRVGWGARTGPSVVCVTGQCDVSPCAMSSLPCSVSHCLSTSKSEEPLQEVPWALCVPSAGPVLSRLSMGRCTPG